MCTFSRLNDIDTSTFIACAYNAHCNYNTFRFDSIQFLLAVLLVAVPSAVLDKYWCDTFAFSIMTVSIAFSTSIGHRWRRGTITVLQLVRADTSILLFKYLCNFFPISYVFKWQRSFVDFWNMFYQVATQVGTQWSTASVHENSTKTKLSTPFNYAFFSCLIIINFRSIKIETQHKHQNSKHNKNTRAHDGAAISNFLVCECV